MLSAGFVVADVRTLDKKQGSFKQITSTAAKQDLVISAYKPNHGLEQRFKLEAGTEDGVWDFVRTHMRQLPSVRFQRRPSRGDRRAAALPTLRPDGGLSRPEGR